MVRFGTDPPLASSPHLDIPESVLQRHLRQPRHNQVLQFRTGKPHYLLHNLHHFFASLLQLDTLVQVD